MKTKTIKKENPGRVGESSPNFNFEEFLIFIETIDIELKEKYFKNSTKQEIAYTSTIKLSEEVGELCNEILKLFKLQREEKLTKVKVESELADVIISTLIIAQTLNLNIKELLQTRQEEISKRFGLL